MTNEAIIILEPSDSQNNHQLLFEDINGKPFLHYQLSYLSENLFKHIVFLIPENENRIYSLFGQEYMDLKITYLNYNQDLGTGGNIYHALNLIDDHFAFILSAKNYFRLNFKKADDFRRMRDSRILHIGKKAMDYKANSTKLFLDEKGKIANIVKAENTEEEDTYITDTWLINKVFYKKQFHNRAFSLFEDYIETNYKEEAYYCLACRQYYVKLQDQQDLEYSKYEFTEYNYK